MKKLRLLFLGVLISLNAMGQNSSSEARKILDEVSTKMSAYKNMQIDFSSTLINEEAGITNDPAIRGNITIQDEKYMLQYLGNDFIFNGKKLAVINHEEKEVNINSGDMEDEDGFIYPSKLLTFYKEGYNFNIGKLKTIKGRKIQIIQLTPIDSNSEIKKVLLGVDAKTKHIYNLQQIGKNGAITTFTINSFKSNQPISEKLFNFNQEKLKKQGYLID